MSAVQSICRMENRSEEWEIVDYHPNCLEDEETTADDQYKSKLGWVMSVGEKLVITGVVISSVPLVLPPLVVISALGFAFSVPFGVVFASYACTEKLMGKLLPSPAVTLDNQTDEEEQEPVVAVDNLESQKEQSDAIRDGIELRIELVLDNDKFDDDGGAGHRDDIRDVERESLARSDKSDNDFLNNIVPVGGTGRLNYKEEPVQGQHSLGQCKDETKPSFSVGSLGEDASFNVQVVQTDEFVENAGENIEGREEFLQDKNEKEHQTVSKWKSSSKEIERRGKKKTLAALRFPEGKRKLEAEGDKRSDGRDKEFPAGTKTSSENNVEGELGGLGEKIATEAGTSTDGLGCISNEEKQAGEKEYIMPRGSRDFDHKVEILLNDVIANIDSSLERADKHGTVSETAERLSIKDEGVDKEIEHCSVIVHEDPGENHNESRLIADDGHYSLEVAALSSMPALEHDEEISHLKEENDARPAYYGLRFNEELFHDEMIWEKLDAIKVIVGFKAPRHPSYLEELKALYLFTGIEPPRTTKDPCDFADFYHKLCFLMSVIGLK